MLSDDEWAAVEEMGILVDKDDQGVLLQVGVARNMQHELYFDVANETLITLLAASSGSWIGLNLMLYAALPDLV